MTAETAATTHENDEYSGQTLADELRRTLDEQPQSGQETISEPRGREFQVTPEARERLEGWGLSAEQIARLIEIGSSYEYANVVGKAENIAKRGGYIGKEQDYEGVVLPELYDYAGDRKDGQCGEIAVKLLRELNDGWLEDVNNERLKRGLPLITPIYFTGLAKTHFEKPGCNHVWTGIAPAGDDTEEVVTIDGSFGVIDIQENTGYQTESAQINPLAATGFSSSRHLATGSFEESPDSWRLTPMESAVLGVTTDGLAAVSVGFVQSQQTGAIRSYVQAVGANSDNMAHVITSDSGYTLWSHTNEVFVTDETRRELEATLAAVSKTKIIYDRKRAKKLMKERKDVQFLSR